MDKSIQMERVAMLKLRRELMIEETQRLIDDNRKLLIDRVIARFKEMGREDLDFAGYDPSANGESSESEKL